MIEKTFTVPNMNCGGCRSTIEDALAGLPDVRVVDVSMEEKRWTLSFPDAEVWKTVVATIQTAGFKVV